MASELSHLPRRRPGPRLLGAVVVAVAVAFATGLAMPGQAVAGAHPLAAAEGFGPPRDAVSPNPYGPGAWGDNSYFQLGAIWRDGVPGWLNNGQFSQTATSPVPIEMFDALKDRTVVQVSAGYRHACAVTSDGDLFCWGNNEWGQLGDGSYNTWKAWPSGVTQDGFLKGKSVVQVSAGRDVTCAVTSDGGVFCWGLNDVGQLGNGTVGGWKTAPMPVKTTGALAGKKVVSVSVASPTPNMTMSKQGHVCAVTDDGGAYCWGSNSEGQLGNHAAGHDSAEPVAVLTNGPLAGRQVTQVATGFAHTCAVTSDGGVFCWGLGQSGQLGNELGHIRDDQPTAVTTSGPLAGKRVTQVALGMYHTCAAATDGSVTCWGYNGRGQLGNPSPTPYSPSPIAVGGGALAGKQVIALAAGGDQTCAVTSDSGAACWGSGMLGAGSQTDSDTPVSVDTSVTLADRQLQGIAVGGYQETSFSFAWGPQKAPVTGPAGMVFVPVAPSRVVDTRVSVGGAGPVVAGVSGMRVFSVASTQAGGVSVVPAGASAIVYNVTVPSPVSSGHLRVMPGDAAVVSSASAINFRAGETIANGLTVKVDAQRRIKVYASVSTDVIVDVVGYFVPASTPGVSGGRFTAVTPTRVYDSAADSAGLLGAHESRVVSVASTQDGVTPVVPAGAGAVAYNITVVRPGAGGHLRVMPGDVASSSASTVNWTVAGDTIANGLTVKVDAQRQLRVFNGSGAPVRFLIDVAGYYSSGGALFYPADPVRVVDTRTAAGGAGPVGPGVSGQRTVSVAAGLGDGSVQVPAGATAVAYNLTVTNTTAGGHLRLFPAGSPLVDASVINWPGAGYSRANGSVVGVPASRQLTVYNGSGGPADTLIDTLGYYQ